MDYVGTLLKVHALLLSEKVEEAIELIQSSVRLPVAADDWPLSLEAKNYLVDRIERPAADAECWRWKGTTDRSGYGKTASKALGKAYPAHKAVYMAFVGPVPFGHQLDHVCGNRWCCNPCHMEPVDAHTNTIRGVKRAVEKDRATRNRVDLHATSKNIEIDPSTGSENGVCGPKIPHQVQH